MDTEQRVRAFVVENFLLGDDSGLDFTQSLLDSGVVDSTGVMELVMFIEDTYKIKVEDSELVPENLDTIASVAAFVRQKLTTVVPQSSKAS